VEVEPGVHGWLLTPAAAGGPESIVAVGGAGRLAISIAGAVDDVLV